MRNGSPESSPPKRKAEACSESHGVPNAKSLHRIKGGVALGLLLSVASASPVLAEEAAADSAAPAAPAAKERKGLRAQRCRRPGCSDKNLGP